VLLGTTTLTVTSSTNTSIQATCRRSVAGAYLVTVQNESSHLLALFTAVVGQIGPSVPRSARTSGPQGAVGPNGVAGSTGPAGAVDRLDRLADWASGIDVGCSIMRRPLPTASGILRRGSDHTEVSVLTKNTSTAIWWSSRADAKCQTEAEAADSQGLQAWLSTPGQFTINHVTRAQYRMSPRSQSDPRGRELERLVSGALEAEIDYAANGTLLTNTRKHMYMDGTNPDGTASLKTAATGRMGLRTGKGD